MAGSFGVAHAVKAEQMIPMHAVIFSSGWNDSVIIKNIHEYDSINLTKTMKQDSGLKTRS